MGSPRKLKESKVKRFQGELSAAKAMVLADYKGLTVGEMEDLRSKLREAGGHIRVIKNTLAKIALNDLGIESLDGDLGGQVAFVFSDTDAVVGTKVAHEYARKNDKFKLLGGYFDGRRIGIDEVRALALLPSREELRSRTLGVLVAPLMDIVGTLTAPMTEFISTLEARGAKLEKGEKAEAAA